MVSYRLFREIRVRSYDIGTGMRNVISAALAGIQENFKNFQGNTFFLPFFILHFTPHFVRFTSLPPYPRGIIFQFCIHK